MKMSKLSNQTNSQDPQAVNSRLFVGNLNTFQCSKTDVERMFQRYGRLAGISMHKGYAFVQFTNPFDARNACHGEDGRTVLSQVLDVNMVAEPKPHQTGRKRQNKSKTGNDWDYYYDSYYASTLFTAQQTQQRPVKRQRLMAPQNRLSITHASGKLNGAAVLIAPQIPQLQIQQQQLLPNNSTSPTPNCNNNINFNGIHTNSTNGCNGEINGNMFHYTNGFQQQQQQHIVGPFKVYSNPDTLICGNCREMFTDLSELLDHKRTYCKLRFTCKCQGTVTTNKSVCPSAKLLCSSCKDSFTNPWDLMVHAQAAHMVNIYELGDSEDERTDSDSDHQNVTNGNGIECMEIEKPTVQKESTTLKNASSSEDIHSETGSDDLLNGDAAPRACIMRTLAIDTKANPDVSTALSINLTLANGSSVATK